MSIPLPKTMLHPPNNRLCRQRQLDLNHKKKTRLDLNEKVVFCEKQGLFACEFLAEP
jgi:hypothetical protein